VSELPWRLVTVDIDGTLTVGHGWAEIADAFGRRAEYDRSQGRFFAHEIGEDQHLGNLLALATGRKVAELEAVLARTPVLDGIRAGVAALTREGAYVALLSHNPDYVLDWYRRSFGFVDGEGVPVPVAADGTIAPPGPVHAGKAAGLAALLARSGASYRTTAHIGDGWADAELFPTVGGGVAVNTRLPEVARAADVALTTRDFGDVVRALERLRPRG
jgi:phosphoserine phosphatase